MVMAAVDCYVPFFPIASVKGLSYRLQLTVCKEVYKLFTLCITALPAAEIVHLSHYSDLV